MLRALHHKDHHYTNFIQPELLAFHSFSLEPNQKVLSLQLSNQRSTCPGQFSSYIFWFGRKIDYNFIFAFVAGMTIAKLNKDKLKRMMEQKDAVAFNLGKKRMSDLAPKQASEEGFVRPFMIHEPVPAVQVLASSVEVIEPIEAPSSSKVVDKAPTLRMDASLALRRAKSVVTKEDMDEYGKLNTDVVKTSSHPFIDEGILLYCHSSPFFFFLSNSSSL